MNLSCEVTLRWMSHDAFKFNISAGKDLVLSGNKPLHKSIFDPDWYWRMASLGHNELRVTKKRKSASVVGLAYHPDDTGNLFTNLIHQIKPIHPIQSHEVQMSITQLNAVNGCSLNTTFIVCLHAEITHIDSVLVLHFVTLLILPTCGGKTILRETENIATYNAFKSCLHFSHNKAPGYIGFQALWLVVQAEFGATD